MILYNVTVNVEDSIHEEWLEWMKSTHIPDVLKTGLFESNKLYKLITRQEDESGHTYSVQYFLKDMESYRTYNQEFAPALQAIYNERYQGKYAAFRSLLEEV